LWKFFSDWSDETRTMMRRRTMRRTMRRRKKSWIPKRKKMNLNLSHLTSWMRKRSYQNHSKKTTKKKSRSMKMMMRKRRKKKATQLVEQLGLAFAVQATWVHFSNVLLIHRSNHPTQLR
jgi:hypothetical protein